MATAKQACDWSFPLLPGLQVLMYRSFSYSAPEVSLAGDWPQLQKEDSQLLKAWDQMNERLFYRNPYLFTFLLLLLIL